MPMPQVRKSKILTAEVALLFSNEEPHTAPSQSNGQGALNLDGRMLLSELAPLVNAQGLPTICKARHYRTSSFGTTDVAASLGSAALMRKTNPVNILLVDDQPSKLISYEAVLSELGENLIKAGSAREALEYLLKYELRPKVGDGMKG
jgi:PleD family two-component response regulator